jgi:hypothetical protein
MLLVLRPMSLLHPTTPGTDRHEGDALGHGVLESGGSCSQSFRPWALDRVGVSVEGDLEAQASSDSSNRSGHNI